MSIWTHVAGCFRIDAVRGLDFSEQIDFDKLLGKTCNFNSSEKEWEECNVPCGSEGSIEFSIWTNPDECCLASYTISVFGDLRDFEVERISEIKKWFEKVVSNCSIRNAVIVAETSGYKSMCMYTDHDEDYNVIIKEV